MWMFRAYAQDMKTPWVQVDTGSPWLDFLQVGLMLMFIAALFILILYVKARVEGRDQP